MRVNFFVEAPLGLILGSGQVFGGLSGYCRAIVVADSTVFSAISAPQSDEEQK